MFRSAHDALRFAFRTLSTPIVKLTSLYAKTSGGSDMTPHDRHAQAAMILSIVERAVDVNGMAYLLARYGKELSKGEKERAVADTLVRVAIASMPTGMHSKRGVEKLVRAYFGQTIGMKATQLDLKCNNRRYYEYKEWVNESMGRIGLKAEDDAHRALEAAGLITLEEVAA